MLVSVGVVVPAAVAARSAQAGQEALQSLESPDLRTIRFFASPSEHDVMSQLLRTFERMDSIESVAAFGRPVTLESANHWPNDLTISALPSLTDGQRQCGSVSVPAEVGWRSTTMHYDSAPAYLPVVGVRSNDSDGRVGLLVPSSMAIVWRCELAHIHSVAARFRAAADLEAVEHSLPLLVRSPEVEVDLPEDLGPVRASVAESIAASVRSLAVGSSIATGLVVGLALLLVVLTDLKEYARRRVVGARRSDLALLVAGQALVMWASGVVLALLAHFLARLVGQPVFGRDSVLIASTAVLALAWSAFPLSIAYLLAARAEPARLLRVP